LINSTQEVFFIYSSDRSQLLFVSSSYEQVWGRPSESLYQEPASWLEALHPEDREQVRVVFEQQPPEISSVQEYRIIHPDGAVRWISARSSVVYDRAGTLNHIVVFAEDITERTHSVLHNRETKFRTFLEAASEAVIVSKSNGEVTLFNRKAEEIFGYSQAEMLGQSVECLMPDRFRQRHIGFREGYYVEPSQRSMGQARDLSARRKDGSEFPIEAGLSSVQIGGEQFVLTFLTDISDRKRIEDERKRAEEKLRESEEHLRYTVTLNPQVQWTADPDGRITDFSERWLQLTGLTREQALGTGWVQVPHPDDLSAMVAAWTHSVTTGEPYDIQHRIKLADGSYRWMRSRAFPRRNEQNQIVRWYGTTEDIHDMKCVEEQLRESEERFRNMADNAPVMIWVTDATGYCTYLSKSWYEFTGQTEATSLGLGWLNAVHPDDQQFSETLFLKANEHHEDFRVEYRLRHKDGEYRWAFDTASPWFDADGQFKGYIGSVIDISDRKQTEQALQESEARLKLAYKATQSGLWDWDIHQNCAHVSEEYCVLFGLPSTTQTVSYEQWLSLLHPDDRTSASEAVNRIIQQRQDYYEDEYRVLHSDGVRWLSARGQVFYDAVGNPVRMLGNMQDITERKHAEEALRLSEERYRSLVEATTLSVWVVDAQGHGVEVASNWIETTGQAPEAASAWAWLEYIHPNDREQARQQFSRCLETGELYEIEHRVLSTTGEYRLYLAKAAPVYNADGSIREWVGTLNDITEQKQAEKDLRQSEATLRQAQDSLRQANQELEHRVAQRTTELLQLNDRLQQELLERERSQQILQEQAQLLDLAHDTIMTSDLDGTITFWNQGAEKMYGWTKGEAIGRISHDLLRTRFSIPLANIQAELLKHNYWEGELVHINRKGIPITVASRWVLQRDRDNTPLKILEINNNITERKRAEDIYQRLAAIVESSDDGIISTTLDGTIVSWNPGAERIYGYSAQDVIGQPVQQLLPPDRKNEEIQIIEQLKYGRSVEHYETVRLHKSGKPINVSLTVSPIKNAVGEVIGISKIARDTTTRMQAEEQLRVSNERISLANAELARAARLKDEFLAGMSHELRTPLNAILGLSEALLEEIFGELTEEQREHLTTIEQSGRHLLELINDILDLSKVESGKMELDIKSVSVRELCESSLSFVKQQAHHKRIKLDCHIDSGLIDVEVDERRLRQVLVNLLSNAVKFTPDGGCVQLQARADSFHETVELSVTDSGIGIAPENIGKLFQPFVQLDSSLSRRYAGTGLGLALVRRIAELHGGSVRLESQEGKGSRFTVTLPWTSIHLPESTAEPEAVQWQELTLQQALIVEDSEAAANQIARYLTELGAKTLVHPRGNETVQIAARSHPDVIILDILLPDRSGWDVLAELKANPATQAIPVIMVSVVDERSRSLDMGAAAHLLKPFTRQQIQQTLTRVIAIPGALDDQTALVFAPTQTPKLPLILLAEDNEANVMTLNSYLQARGLRVILARNGLEAVQMAKQHTPNLILMDIQMPEMDGLEAIQQIRAESNLQGIPIIALTALAMPGDRERCLAVGATDYLTKPVSLKHLLQILTHHIPQLHSREGN
jgi:PAS domain S-box-containing protein